MATKIQREPMGRLALSDWRTGEARAHCTAQPRILVFAEPCIEGIHMLATVLRLRQASLFTNPGAAYSLPHVHFCMVSADKDLGATRAFFSTWHGLFRAFPRVHAGTVDRASAHRIALFSGRPAIAFVDAQRRVWFRGEAARHDVDADTGCAHKAYARMMAWHLAKGELRRAVLLRALLAKRSAPSSTETMQ